MVPFRVTSVVDGDTFEVFPDWAWRGQTGSRVRLMGYDAPAIHVPGGEAARANLERLILGKHVELRVAHKVDGELLVCDVYLDGRNLTEHFPEGQDCGTDEAAERDAGTGMAAYPVKKEPTLS